MASRLLQRLARAGRRDLRPHVASTEIACRRRGASCWSIANGTRITADHAIVAAGYAAQQWIPQRVAHNRSSYAFISDPLDDARAGLHRGHPRLGNRAPLPLHAQHRGRPPARRRRRRSRRHPAAPRSPRRFQGAHAGEERGQGDAATSDARARVRVGRHVRRDRRTACRSSARTRQSARACSSRWPTAATASRTRRGRWVVACACRTACASAQAPVRVRALGLGSSRMKLRKAHPRRLRPRPRRARAQPQGRRRRHPARCARRVLRRIGVGQVVARVRHDLCRSAAALFRIGRRRMRGG